MNTEKKVQDDMFRSALMAQFEEELEQYRQEPEPPENPAFEAAMQTLLRQQDSLTRMRRAAAKWVAAAAVFAVILAGAWAALPAVRQWAGGVISRLDTLETEYTLGYLPSECTEAYRHTSSTTSYTRWESGDASQQIVLIQNQHSTDALLNTQGCESRRVTVMDVAGTLYTKTNYTALTWSTEKYLFTMIVQGQNASPAAVLSMAESLITVK